MKKLYRTIDKEEVFYEDEVTKAREYLGAPAECTTLEDIADWWNAENSGNGIGEMVVKEI